MIKITSHYITKLCEKDILSKFIERNPIFLFGTMNAEV